MSSPYWYPSMPIHEIMEALDGWSFSVSQEQLIRPSSEFVMSVYTACLQQVTGITQESLKPSVNAAIATLDSANADLYSQSLTQNFLLHHITRFATAARFPDFCAKDIHFPEPERTRLILSAFINLVKFHEQCAPTIAQVRQNDAALEAERERAAGDLAEMEAKLAAIKAKRAEDEPRCEELRQEQIAIAAKLVAYKDVHTDLVKQIDKLKAEKAAVLQRKDNLNKEISVVVESISHKRSRIVQSPERIKRNVASMRATAAEDKQTLAANEAKIRDLKIKINVIMNIDKEIRSCVEQLQTVAKEVNILESSQQELAELKEQLTKKKIEKSDLERRHERVRQQLLNAEEKLERAQKHAAEKRLASQQTIERLQRDYEQMAAERRDNDKQMEELRAEANLLEEKKARHLKQSEAELGELLHEYWTLRHETEVYMETLANKLGMHVTETND
ncbi:hypothetical protein GLOTRDRAFT_139579 [Gloeophyllum trabeum ATCC 11539]|uniref:Uncharacterized protein n=1 Tax=Gloeophyllum trabeum (strain ATCC 11539 / FP-39264 / Madison 617) TaxID=670483 RepID=S7RIS1_GLOTA|nr:uncharacterized protein GLOTRDRAFT_139579 [Gloeophyllum trabeum ATCC 11539]EPQ54245.1 hypothetical protein GLOTRDRAFT_139579 [Gloeophyllum trabeum ATCC 11539]